MADLKALFTTELRIRGTVRREIADILRVVEQQVTELVRSVREQDYQALTEAMIELVEYNAYLLSLDARLKMSDKSDERPALLALDNALKLIRYTREDIRAIAQLTMNQANNAT